MKNFIKKHPFASPTYWPAWAGISVLWLITRLPITWQLRIGQALGRLLYLFPSKLKHITTINIKLCFPELTPNEQTNLAKKNFESLGLGLIETAMAWWLPDEKLQQLFTLNGLEYAEEAFQKGKGILLLGPHFTCLEIVGRIISMKYSFAVMYRPHKKKLLAFIHERFRKRHYVNYIPRHRIRDLLRALENNTAIWYAYDIDGGDKHSVFAPFFGIQTASLTSASRIAQLSQTTVIPLSFRRLPHSFKYEVTLSKPLIDFPGQDLQDDATRLNATLEEAIRLAPEQYVWQYKRFKTRPSGEARFY